MALKAREAQKQLQDEKNKIAQTKELEAQKAKEEAAKEYAKLKNVIKKDASDKALNDYPGGTDYNSIYKEAMYDLLQKQNRNSRFRQIKHAIAGFFNKLIHPFRTLSYAVGQVFETITWGFVPKDDRQTLLNNVLNDIRKEEAEQKKTAKLENTHTMKKKADIINDKKLTNEEKIMQLCVLCKDTGKTITVPTDKGAFQFEELGGDVFIKHAYDEVNNKDNSIKLDYTIVGGVTFGESLLYERMVDSIDFLKVSQILQNGEKFDLDRDISKAVTPGIIKEEKEPSKEQEKESQSKEEPVNETGEPEKPVEYSKEEEQTLDEAVMNNDKESIKKVMEEKIGNLDVPIGPPPCPVNIDFENDIMPDSERDYISEPENDYQSDPSITTEEFTGEEYLENSNFGPVRMTPEEYEEYLSIIEQKAEESKSEQTHSKNKAKNIEGEEH